ncbi:uncharacterized protein [Montipora foliosa]|uniref:uncharacterized protein n=1 Tax=Montipora foliosa TaxID=591990 RepID=UPI0035F15D05
MKATRKCHVCKEDHWLTRCCQFKKQSVEQRLTFVRKQGLWENCFQPGHKVHSCPKNSYCKIPTCHTKHSTFLLPKSPDRNFGHLPSNEGPITEGDRRVTGNNNNSAVNGDSQCASSGAGVPMIGLPIVPFKVRARSADPPVLTYALLDSGSNTTFCSRQLMEMLTVDGEQTTLSLTTLGKHNSVTECKVEVFDLNERNCVELPTVFSTPQLPVSKNSIQQQEDLNKYPYLKGIQLPKIDAPIGLLIGNDVPKALEPKQVLWTLNGPLDRKGNSRRTANFIKADKELSQQFTRNAPRNLLNNGPLAEYPLKLLRRRLLKDEDLHSKYSAFIDNFLKNGHARKVPGDRLDLPVGAVWYLPHHAALNANKPSKVRVVSDCAAKYQGTSLNDQLLQGPDLTNNLVGVLTHFRQEPVAVMADVESMFHQVCVSPNNCDTLRYPWWPNNDLNSEPEEYQMMLHLFGTTSSPSCANFSLRRTAEDNCQ